MKPKALLFDLGGVVIDIDFDRSFEAWGMSSGIDPKTLKSRWSFEGPHADHEIDALTIDAFHDQISQKLAMKLSLEDFVRGWNAILGKPIPETQALLADLAPHYPLFLFSNSNITHRMIWAKTFAYELRWFRKVFCSSVVKMRKPNTKAFEYVVRECGYNPNDVLFIDDLSQNIEGAKKAGLHAYHFGSPRDSTQQLRALLLDP